MNSARQLFFFCKYWKEVCVPVVIFCPSVLHFSYNNARNTEIFVEFNKKWFERFFSSVWGWFLIVLFCCTPARQILVLVVGGIFKYVQINISLLVKRPRRISIVWLNCPSFFIFSRPSVILITIFPSCLFKWPVNFYYLIPFLSRVIFFRNSLLFRFPTNFS